MEKAINKKYIKYIILILILMSILILFNIKNLKKDNEEKANTKYFLLSDYSDFFTVDNCIYKYISYLQKKDSQNLLKILDSDYISKNQINVNNLYNYVDDLNGNYSFVSKKIYYNQIDTKNIFYYVYGYLIEDTIDGLASKKIDKYFLVKFNLDNNTFSLQPLVKTKFEEISNG